MTLGNHAGPNRLPHGGAGAGVVPLPRSAGVSKENHQ